jgi:uncharacterized protein (TIGR00661 family)
MKILYGVQATGNGHISRARALAPLLKQLGVEVTYLFSGRESKDFFDMEAFGDYKVKAGLTFQSSNGSLDLFKTLIKVKTIQFIKDVKGIDLTQYDLFVSDFEPIVAWAAKLSGRECIGISHQYAFSFDIPRYKSQWAAYLFKWFAPSNKQVGLHWSHFNYPILPPIVLSHDAKSSVDPRKVLVYLPFEMSLLVIDLLRTIKEFEFLLHCKDVEPGQYGNVTVYPFGLDRFQKNLRLSQSVLCNAGFELNSEALALGKRILVKPLKGQVEQHSNAIALEMLGLAQATDELTAEGIRLWLDTQIPVQVDYPDTAAYLAQWLSEGALTPVEDMAKELWSQVYAMDHDVNLDIIASA